MEPKPNILYRIFLWLCGDVERLSQVERKDSFIFYLLKLFFSNVPIVDGQCHYSYSACGLGSDGTDRLVQLVQEAQHSKMSESADGTLFGAKITGGGSGGTVCVIGRNCLRSSEQIIQVIFYMFIYHNNRPL